MRVVISVYVVHVLSYFLVYTAFVLSYCVYCICFVFICTVLVYLFVVVYIVLLFQLSSFLCCACLVFLSCIPLFVLCAMLEQPLAEWFIKINFKFHISNYCNMLCQQLQAHATFVPF